MLSLFFCLNLAKASSDIQDLDYAEVKKEETVPFDGYLFTDEALTGLILEHRGEIMVMEQQHLLNLEDQKVDLEYQFGLEKIKWDAKEQMYKDLIQIRDDQIKLDRRKDYIQRFAFGGGFLLGTAVSIGIVYSVNQN